MRLAVVVTCMTLCTSAVHAQGADTVTHRAADSPNTRMAPFDGTWRLVATRQRMTDGTTRPDPDLGPRPSGFLMFDATTGQMCAVLNNGDRARWGDASHPTDAEARAIWDQTVSYCATWTVDSAGRELVYRLAANLSPNLIGSERRRRFTIDGDRLILYPTPLPAGVVEWAVEWRRTPPASRRP